MAIDAVYTSATFNSYATELEIDTLVEALGASREGASLYLALDSGDKIALILAASRTVAGLSLAGILNPLVIAPRMMYPRSGLYYENGVAASADAVPEEIKQYVASWVLSATVQSTSSSSSGVLRKKTVGPITEEYATDSSVTVKNQTQNIDIESSFPKGWILLNNLYGIGNVGLRRL